MSELRHFLRYQIPGLMFFIHLNAFLYGCDIIGIKQLTKLIVPEFLMAVLLGWIFYQIYDSCYSQTHYTCNSIEIVKKWSNKDINNKRAKHAIQIGLFSHLHQGKLIPDSNIEKLLNTLSKKFDHRNSRIINAYINLLALIIYLTFGILKSNLFFLVVTIITTLILNLIAIKIWKLKEELESYEGMLVHLKKDEIMEATKL